MNDEQMQRTSEDWQVIQTIAQSNQAARYSQFAAGNIDGYPNHDEAELAQLKIFAFYSNANREAVERLHHGSGLYNGNKWADDTHRNRQLDKAIEWAENALKTAYHDVTGALKMPDPLPEWDEVKPLKTRQLPEFPSDCLPGQLANYVKALSEALQVPEAMTATMTLAAIATSVQGKTTVLVRPGWVEPLNIYVLIILPPAERKSGTLTLIRMPLDEYERFMAERLRSEISKQAAEKKALQKLADKYESEYAKKPSAQMLQNLKDATAEAEAFQVEALPRLTTSDCTPEKLASLLHEQGGKMAVMSAEGGIFETLNGRYSQGVNLDVFLAGHAGDKIEIDRLGRPPDRIHKPALTVCLAAQPEVLTKIQKNSAFRGRGLLGRFLYCIPTPMAGRRKIDPEPMPETVQNDYNDLIILLLNNHQEKVLTLDETARRLLNRFSEQIEPKLAPDGEFYAFSDWAGKAAGAAVRIAGLLHMANLEEGTTISGETMQNAIKIMEYYTAHARTALGADDTKDLKTAAKILQAAKTEGWQELTARLLMRNFPAEFHTADDAESVLELLEQYGYIREVQKSGQRGRKAPRYEINPATFQKNSSEGGR